MTPTEFVLTDKDRQVIAEAAKEIDMQQIEIDRRLTVAQRVHKALSLGRLMREIGIHRIRQQHPEMSEIEAQRLWLQQYYELEARWQPFLTTMTALPERYSMRLKP